MIRIHPILQCFPLGIDTVFSHAIATDKRFQFRILFKVAPGQKGILAVCAVAMKVLAQWFCVLLLRTHKGGPPDTIRLRVKACPQTFLSLHAAVVLQTVGFSKY